MKTRTALLFLSLLTALILLMSTGCQSNRVPSVSQEEVTESDTPPSVESKTEYRLIYDGVEFISDEEKEAWRPYLIQRMSYIKGYTDHLVPKGQYAIDACQLYALFDLNLDGVPELLSGFSNFGSGFAPVHPYCFLTAYDLYTGAEVASLNFFISNNTSVYYDVDRGCYKIYSTNYESTRSPGMDAYGGNYTIDRVEVLYENDWRVNTGFPLESAQPYIVSTTYLSTGIDIRGMIGAEPSEDDTGSNRHTYVFGDPRYTKDGEPCEYGEYYAELLHFMSTNILLHNTKLQYISPYYGDDFTSAEDVLANAESLADQLLSLDQQFIRPIHREETTTEVTE